MTRVLKDIKADNAHERAHPSTSTTMGKNGMTKVAAVNGATEGRGEGGKSLALPSSVVDEGVKVTRECLELVIDVGE